MSRAERIAASRALWDAEDPDREAQGEALAYLAERLHLRPRTLARMPDSKRADYLARGGAPPPNVIQIAVVCLHIGPRKAMLIAFLDHLGIPHHEGLIDREHANLQRPGAMALDLARQHLMERYPEDEVRLYLRVLMVKDPETWGGLSGLLDERPEPEREPEESLEEVAEREPEPTVRLGTEFDQLDTVLIKTVVASVAGAEGAPNEDQVRDLVEEVRHLNQERHRSYFHLGFLDVLQERALDTQWPESNADRRAWYLCGALSGLARRGDDGTARALIDAHAHEFELLGSGQHRGASLVVQIIFDVIWQGPEPGSVTQLITPRGLAKAGPAALQVGLDAATERTRGNRGQEARPLLKLVEEATRLLHDHEHFAPPPRFLHDLRRRQAHAARLCGDFDVAREILGELLRNGADEHEAMIRADLGLIECGLRSLADVRLPNAREEWEETATALAPGLKWFEEAAQGEKRYGSHGEFCLGVHSVLKGDCERAQQLLDKAVAEMQQRPRIYAPLRVLPRARLYLAFCLAESLNPAVAERVGGLVERALDTLGSETLYLYADIIRGLALVDQACAVKIAQRLFDVLGEKAIDIIGKAELLRQLPEVRDALLNRADDHQRTRKKRFDDYERLLGAAVRAGDVADAEQALGGLEQLADDEPERSRFLEILAHADQHGGVWSAEDRVFAQVRLLEATAGVEAARGLLEPIGHQLLSDGDVTGAAGIVARIESYGVDADKKLVARLDIAQTETEAPPRETAKGNVLFIGGDETQRNCATDVGSWVAENWPEIRIEFEHPCWSSNWGRQIDGLKTRIARADVVVLMPYVRTQFGRSVRKLCGKNNIAWVACTGKGRKMMRMSVQAAIEILVK